MRRKFIRVCDDKIIYVSVIFFSFDFSYAEHPFFWSLSTSSGALVFTVKKTNAEATKKKPIHLFATNWKTVENKLLIPNDRTPNMLKMRLQLCATNSPTTLAPTNPPMRPNNKMKHVAIARTCVGNNVTEIAVMIPAHRTQLWKVTNVTTIAWNCVMKFKANEHVADTISQAAKRFW